jgi:hypothetical protein
VSTPRRIAIARQGGGRHTAFTAGVLRGLLDPEAAGDRLRGFLGGLLGGEARIDATRTQVARGKVRWSLRVRQGDAAGARAVAEAEFRAGAVVALRVGAAA